MDAITDWIINYGYFGLFGFLMMGIVGVPLPEDLMLAGAGFLVSKGYLKLFPTIIAVYLGSMCGVTVSYWLGRALGIAAVSKYGYHLGITHQRLIKAMSWYERFGKWTLTFGYFIGGFRHVNALLAGALKLPAPAFSAFAYTGAILWSSSLIGVGYFLGEEWFRIYKRLGSQIVPAIAVTATAIILVIIGSITAGPSSGEFDRIDIEGDNTIGEDSSENRAS
jgi:membrane protein DedA with SNARE-associated domain